MKKNFGKSIRNWYHAKYPKDVDGRLWLKRKLDFSDLAYDLATIRDDFDFYKEYMQEGCADSIVRERIFSELANLLETDYRVIYDAWLYDDIEHKQGIRDAITKLNLTNQCYLGYRN